jgi:TolA-binding protein
MDEPVTPLHSLGERVAGALDAHASEREQAVERARRGYLAAAIGSSRPQRGRHGVLMLAAAFAAVLLGAGAFAHFRSRPLEFMAGEQRGVVETWVAAPSARALPLRFSDGTRVRLEPSSRARVVAIDARGASLALENGGLHADVVHSGRSAWRVIAGPLTVRVTGTRFDVRWSASSEEFTVAVTEGSVAISGSVVGAERTIQAGETLRVFVAERRLELSNAATASAPGHPGARQSGVREGEPSQVPATPASAAPASDSKLPAVGRSEPASSAAPRAPDWRELARKGSLREAFALAEASGFDAACQSASAAELLQLGDGARLSGNAGRAKQALLRLRSTFPGDARRAAAAFALGKVAFDHTHAFAEAADWFATSIREQPGGSLSREAAGRLMEARKRAGDHGGARRAAESYLVSYPQGPHADLARSLMR